MTITMNIPDRLYEYLQKNTQTNGSIATLDETVSRAVTEILEQQFEERMNAAPAINHEEFMNILRRANSNEQPSEEDAL
jgi:superoxide dismutase